MDCHEAEKGETGSWMHEGVLTSALVTPKDCAKCHMGSYMPPQGVYTRNSHDVGESISWTLRPVVSAKLNMVIYEDGFKEDYPDTRALPKVHCH